MTYEETLADMLVYAPTVYWTEWDVLEDLFLVAENGFTWRRGALVGPRRKSQQTQMRNLVKCLAVADDQYETLLAAYRDPVYDHERIRELEFEIRQNCRYKPWSTLLSLDPRCALLTIPADIRPDWLDAACGALRMARSDYYERTPEDHRLVERATRLVFYTLLDQQHGCKDNFLEVSSLDAVKGRHGYSPHRK